MHGEPPEQDSSALDALFRIHRERLLLEEGPCREAGVSGDARDTEKAQRRLNRLVEQAGYAASSVVGMSEKKVEVTIVGVGGKACQNAVRLGDHGIKSGQPLLPAPRIGCNRSPRRDLLRRIIRRGQLANRSGISLDEACQIG